MTAALIFSMGTLLCPPEGAIPDSLQERRLNGDWILFGARRRAAGAAGAAATFPGRALAHPARTHPLRPADALRPHRHAVPDMDRQQPRARALHPRAGPA